MPNKNTIESVEVLGDLANASGPAIEFFLRDEDDAGVPVTGRARCMVRVNLRVDVSGDRTGNRDEQVTIPLDDIPNGVINESTKTALWNLLIDVYGAARSSLGYA